MYSWYISLSIVYHTTYNKISYDNRWNEKKNRSGGTFCGPHAIPEGLDPFPTQHSEHHHERVPKVNEIPARDFIWLKLVWCVGFAKHFHSHQSKDVDHKTQDESDVSDWSDAVGYCCQQSAHRLPGLSQL